MSAGRLHFVVPGDIETPTGGYGYDRQVADGLRGLGWDVGIVSLADGFPEPNDAALRETEREFASLPDGALVLVDGLAFARIPDIARRHTRRVRLAVLVHHPLADEGGLPEGTRTIFERDEIAALKHARLVICTSRTTGRRLTDHFDVAPSNIRVAPPGTERKKTLTQIRTRNLILCVASVVPRKGHDVLIAALGALRDLEWTARFVGPVRDTEWLAWLEDQAAHAGIADRIAFVGAVADPADEYARAGIFALATRHEGYGMAYAEALAAGLPVVGCAVGAVPEVVPPDAGGLVEPDDPHAFAGVLRRLLSDPEAYDRAASGARRAAKTLPRWEETVKTIAGALQEIG